MPAAASSVRRQRRFARRRLLLARPHRGVDAAFGKQLAVMAALDDMPAVEHQYLIGVDHGRTGGGR